MVRMSIWYYKLQFGPGLTREWGPYSACFFLIYSNEHRWTVFGNCLLTTGTLYSIEGMQMKCFQEWKGKNSLSTKLKEIICYTLRQALKIIAFVGPAISYRAQEYKQPSATDRGLVSKVLKYI